MRRLFLQSNPPIILGPWTKISDTQYNLTSTNRSYYPYTTTADSCYYYATPYSDTVEFDVIQDQVDNSYYELKIKVPDNMDFTGYKFKVRVSNGSSTQTINISYGGISVRKTTKQFDSDDFILQLNGRLSRGYIIIKTDNYNAYMSEHTYYRNFYITK